MAPGWSWDTNPATWMQVRGNILGGEMQTSWHGSGFDVTWIEVKHKYRHLGGAEMGPGLSWGAHHETWIWWDGTRMELGCNFLDLDGCGMQLSGHVLRWNVVCMDERRDAGDTGPGWRWDANLCTLMEVRWYTDGVNTSILGFGFLWDRTWMEVRYTFLKPGWVWDNA